MTSILKYDIPLNEAEYVEVADLFCGTGGSSTGAQHAIEELGMKMRLRAVNHWPVAIETHSLNHPDAMHVVEDVSIVDPEELVPDGYLDLLMASPECTYHSRARGGKPIHDQGRMNPWAIHNWLTKLDVRCVIIENVPEFVAWGPLDENDRPDKARKGEHFEAWFLTFLALGYQAEWRMLNAADFGEATTRTRFFLIARKDGAQLQWPEPTHAKSDAPLFPGRLPWRGAREIIDWTNLGRSLLDDPKYQRRPLSEKTRRRIARGLERFGGPLAPLYIRLLDLPEYDGIEQGTELGQGFIVNRHPENGSARVHSVDDPMPTATGRGAGYLVQPDAQPFIQANRNENAPRSLDDPVPVVTTAHGGGSFLVEAASQPFVLSHARKTAPRSTDDPLPTNTTRGPGYLVESEAQPFVLGQQSAGAPRSTEEPIPTIAAAGAISVVRPCIIEYYGDIRARGVDSPVSTITQRIKHAVINPSLVRYNGTSMAEDIDDPLSTITAQARKHGLVNPLLVEYYGQSGAADIDRPVPTITTKDRHGLANPVLLRTSQTGGGGHYSRPMDEPIPSLTTKADIVLATPVGEPYIVPNFGEADGQKSRCHSIDDPTPTVTSKGAGNLVSPLVEEVVLDEIEAGNIDPLRIVFIDGQPYLLDIRFRMLQNDELARAMGFDDEESQYEFVGNVGEVTKQIGNAVPVNPAAALVKAVLA